MKRCVAFDGKGFAWCTDGAHVEKMIQHCFGDKPSTERKIGPSSKSSGKSAKNAVGEFGDEKRTAYKAMVPTAQYVAADRPDIQYTTAVLMRSLETPTVLQQLKLYRLGRYLKNTNASEWQFEY